TAAASARGTTFETTHTRRDGTPVPVEISSSVLEIDGQQYRQSMIRDITDRKAAETALNQQLHELRRWNALTLGREGRVLALKGEVNELLDALGRPPRYEEDPLGQGGVGRD
ncbi:MAG: PAS domain S-box protein, partial [Chloroflexota bacterium]|nr:PAS domain S-box protein [Chloroflexota bacterium]